MNLSLNPFVAHWVAALGYQCRALGSILGKPELFVFPPYSSIGLHGLLHEVVKMVIVPLARPVPLYYKQISCRRFLERPSPVLLGPIE